MISLLRAATRIRQKAGFSSFLAIFLAALILLSAGIGYAVAVSYSNHQDAKVRMERAITSAITWYIKATHIREVDGQLSSDDIELFALNYLADHGLTRTDGQYALLSDSGAEAYRVGEFEFEYDSVNVKMTGTLQTKFPFALFSNGYISIPVRTTARLHYISHND